MAAFAAATAADAASASTASLPPPNPCDVTKTVGGLDMATLAAATAAAAIDAMSATLMGLDVGSDGAGEARSETCGLDSIEVLDSGTCVRSAANELVSVFGGDDEG